VSFFVFIIVILAAILHAGWNAMVKNQPDKLLGITALIFGYVPWAVFFIFLTQKYPPKEVLPYVFFSAILHIGYQFFLFFSYRIGNYLQVYPIARGSSPIIILVLSIFLLKMNFSNFQLISVLFICAGILSLVLLQKNTLYNISTLFFSLGTGFFIALYSLVDGFGARLANAPITFFAWSAILNATIFAIIVCLVKPGLISRIPKFGKKMFFLGGAGSFFAYTLVVWAFTEAPIVLVTALRETSIIFALLIGFFFLKEKLNLLKIFSVLLIFLGAVILRLS
jgi:drug/metabolite transporter (DMT)-like permease